MTAAVGVLARLVPARSVSVAPMYEGPAECFPRRAFELDMVELRGIEPLTLRLPEDSEPEEER